MKRKTLVVIITIGLFSLLIGGMELYYYVDNTEFLEEVNNMKSEFAIQTLGGNYRCGRNSGGGEERLGADHVHPLARRPRGWDCARIAADPAPAGASGLCSSGSW